MATVPSTAGDCGQCTRDEECTPRAISPFVLNDEKSSRTVRGCHCSVALWLSKCRVFARRKTSADFQQSFVVWFAIRAQLGRYFTSSTVWLCTECQITKVREQAA